MTAAPRRSVRGRPRVTADGHLLMRARYRACPTELRFARLPELLGWIVGYQIGRQIVHWEE